MAAPPPPSLRRVPGAMTVGAVVVIVAGLVLLGWALTHRAGSEALPTTHTPISQATVDPAGYAARLRTASNDERAHAGLPRLADAPCAAAVAQQRAELLVGQPLQHAPLDALRRACPDASAVAENLSRAAALPGAVVAAWMASPGHRANILDPTLTGMVVACTHDGDQMLCSQLFVGKAG